MNQEMEKNLLAENSRSHQEVSFVDCSLFIPSFSVSLSLTVIAGLGVGSGVETNKVVHDGDQSLSNSG